MVGLELEVGRSSALLGLFFLGLTDAAESGTGARGADGEDESALRFCVATARASDDADSEKVISDAAEEAAAAAAWLASLALILFDNSCARKW